MPQINKRQFVHWRYPSYFHKQNTPGGIPHIQESTGHCPAINYPREIFHLWMVSPKSQIGIAALTSMAGETGFENPYLLRLVGNPQEERTRRQWLSGLAGLPRGMAVEWPRSERGYLNESRPSFSRSAGAVYSHDFGMPGRGSKLTYWDRSTVRGSCLFPPTSELRREDWLPKRIGITGDFPLLSVHAYFFHFPRGERRSCYITY